MHAQIVKMNIPFIEHHKCSSSPKRKKKIYHYIPTQWIPMVKQVQEAKPKNFSPSNKKQQNRMAIKILKMNPKLVYDVFRDFKAYQGIPAFNVLSRTALLSLWMLENRVCSSYRQGVFTEQYTFELCIAAGLRQKNVYFKWNWRSICLI